jgi:hypothetical protein
MSLNRRKNPNATLPIAMMFLMIAVLWPHFIQPSLHPGPDWNDFLRGAVLGMAIGMLLMTGINMRSQRRCDQRQAPTENDPAPRP